MKIARPTIKRSLGKTVLWMTVAVLVAAGINRVGVGVAGDITSWHRWLDDHAGYFLIWRLCLYGATGYGWLWLRRRQYQDADARQRLVRVETGAVTALLLLEASVWLL
ncbi:MAG: hypothetical protein ACK5HY_08355 [Parahaliea sp.]